jgi:hypothetical protein
MAKDKPAAPVVNKYAAKVTQDGVELTWNAEKLGPLDAQDAANFYTESVNALQKFKKADPRTRPDLQAWEKLIKGAFSFIVGAVFIVTVAWFAFHAGAGDFGRFQRGNGWNEGRDWRW